MRKLAFMENTSARTCDEHEAPPPKTPSESAPHAASPQGRPFSDSHIENLQKGAKRRNEEQIVGNYVRRVNIALFQQLLHEALHPQSKAIANVIKHLEANDLLGEGDVVEPQQTFTVPQQRPTITSAHSVPKTSEPMAHRPPPPRLDIL